MGVTLNRAVGRNSSGRIIYSGTVTYGRVPRRGGGYEWGEVAPNSPAAKSRSLIEQQATERAISRINRRRADAGQPPLVGTEPVAPVKPEPQLVSTMPVPPVKPEPQLVSTQPVPPVKPEPQLVSTMPVPPVKKPEPGPVKTFTSPILNRPVTQAELEQYKSQARTNQAMAQARAEDPFSNRRVVLPTPTSGTFQPAGTSPSYYRGPSLDKRQRIWEPAPKETYEQRFSRYSDQNRQQSLMGKPGLDGVKTQAIGVGIGLGTVALGVAQTIRHPVRSVNSGAKAIFDRIGDPRILATDADNLGALITNTPGQAIGILGGTWATGKVATAAVGLPNKARFIGKTEAPQTYIAPSFLSGKEIYPKGKPAVVVDNINRQGFAFSASPTRLSSGAADIKIFTQAQKKAAGLEVSETGGLYAADRISPQFTQLVQRGAAEPYRFSLLPRFGSPGSIQKILTTAERLPKGIKSKGVAASNEFLDLQAAYKKPGVAFSSPAAEIMRKAEAEVIIPGGSNLVRTQKYGSVKRVLGTDFDTYVRIPTKFNTQGKVVKTTKVAVREYSNLGSKVPGVASITDDIGRGSSSYRSSNPGVFRVPPFSSAGSSRGRDSRSSVTPITGIIPLIRESSIASSSGASRSAAPSSSLFNASGSKGSAAARRSVSEPFISAFSSVAPSSLSPWKYSSAYSVSRAQPFPSFVNRGASPDISINKKNYKQPRIKKSESYLYAPTFTAAFFGVKATAKDKKIIAKSGFYTGLETIRPLV